MSKRREKNTLAFISLLKAGLWEKDIRFLHFDKIDFKDVYRLAEEQSVVGLIVAGLEHVEDSNVQQNIVLNMVGGTLQLETRNKAMNLFIANLIEKLNKEGIHPLLVKGQGIAQCYERPLWRACGDIDLLFDSENYIKAKGVLLPIAKRIDPEDEYKKHQALIIKNYDVELHGRMPFAISERVDRVLDRILEDSTKNCGEHTWLNNETFIPIPEPNNNVVIIFTHFLHHFFIEGVGLRQICDWCRLLWTSKDEIDKEKLKSRLDEMGLLTEWRTFAYVAVQCLGMPQYAMPFYTDSITMKYRAKIVLNHILKCGNLGHNNDNSYRNKYPQFLSNVITVIRRMKDFAKFFFVFPIDTPVFFFTYLRNRI